jgi:ABC-type enterochelin transport system ATPase subunit
MNIGFSDITKSYGEKLIARHFTLPIEASAVTCLMDPPAAEKQRAQSIRGAHSDR